MCGIAGVISFNNSLVFSEVLLEMGDALSHRGPDNVGFYRPLDRKLGFTHRRLSIIDLSEAAHQPMCNEDKTVWITYNGEIYNYRELGDKLRKLGHKFKSNSDTEVVIHGYEQWGIEGLLERLRGMFAFALYDSRLNNSQLKTPDPCNAKHTSQDQNSKLLLARDRLGIKPLYFCYDNDTFIFASEIKAILTSKLVSGEIDLQAAGLFLSYGSVPPPKTIYKEISALEPGHYMVVAENGIKKVRYYDLKNAFLDTSLQNISEEQAIENVRSCLIDTIKCHLVSDVPIGVFLSGGIDSASVIALMQEVEHKPIKTISVIFPDTPYDESEFAKLSARKFHTEHVEIDIHDKDVMNHGEKIFSAMDQPTIDGVNTYFVSWAASQAGLKVAMSGVGGDEIFWGYPSFTQISRLKKLSKVLSRVPLGRKTMSFILRNSNNSRRAKLYSIFSKNTSLPEIYLNYRGLFTKEQIQKLLQPDLAKEVMDGVDPVSHIQECSEINDEPNQVSMLEITCYMANQLLRDTDIFSMTHSLEVRVPFVDHKLVELLAKLPAGYKLGTNMPKKLLVKALHNKLPDEIVHHPKKTFTFPFDLWMKDSIREFVEEKLNNSTIFDKLFIRGLLNDFRDRRIHWSRIWGCTVLSHWIK